MRPLASFTENERAVIRERHHGWERCPLATLALIFGAHVNTIRAVCADIATQKRGQCAAISNNTGPGG